MKTVADLEAAVRSGQSPVITCKSRIEEQDSYAVAGMRARIVGAAESKYDSATTSFTLDFSEFEAHNKALEPSNYFDKSGNPTLTAREAGYYKPRDLYYFDQSDDPGAFFDIESSERLAIFETFMASGSDLPYVSWLEQRVIDGDFAKMKADASAADPKNRPTERG